jgi:myo-inositol-1(or 4)-monophosphatase
MHPLINIATKAALSASKIILRATDRLNTIKISEKSHNNFVTETDKQAEQIIIDTILEAYPEHAILGEESGETGKSDHTWIIDPIDGTLNFFHGHPHFCISIGVQVKDTIEHGLIYDPLRQELFTASRGEGAFLNNKRIRVTQRKQFPGSIIASDGGHKNYDAYTKILAKLLPQAAGVRRHGSAALDFAYLACGRVDGILEMDLAPWDIAAGSVIVKEAGGIVDDFEGKGNYFKTGNVIAGNPNIFKLLAQIV